MGIVFFPGNYKVTPPPIMWVFVYQSCYKIFPERWRVDRFPSSALGYGVPGQTHQIRIILLDGHGITLPRVSFNYIFNFVRKSSNTIFFTSFLILVSKIIQRSHVFLRHGPPDNIDNYPISQYHMFLCLTFNN